FIPDLLSRGVRHFVIKEAVRPDPAEPAEAQVQAWLEEHPESHFIIVSSPLGFLQQLAAYHRRQFSIPVLAITGSNGKTIVKDWLAEMLGRQFQVCASPRSFNSQIGVPLSVWRLHSEHELAIFEAGVSESGEMAALAKIIQPTCGVFTMLGAAHAAGFPSEEAKHREKLRLFTGVEWVVVPAKDEATLKKLAKLGVNVIAHHPQGEDLLAVGETVLPLSFPKLPKVYEENAYAAAAAAYYLGLGLSQLQSAVKELHPLSNRLEVRASRDGGLVINDSYSNDFTALRAALEFAMMQDRRRIVTLILGTIQPASSAVSGTRDRAQMDLLLRLFADTGVSRLLTVGNSWQPIPHAENFASPEALLAALPRLNFAKETILVKGASYERLDRIADALSRQHHRTLLRLDLGALRHNFLTYQRAVSAQMIVMVKASAYGGGALPVARTLEAAGAKYLAVAYPDEGVELRNGGLQLPIMVLNAAPDSFPLLAEFALEPVVFDLAGLQSVRKADLHCHLEIDSGMGRLGFAQSEVNTLATALATGRFANSIASVFTHLAASDSPGHDAFTHEQAMAFEVAYQTLTKPLPVPPPRHVLNTNGITRFPEYAHEMVRLGIGLYGIGDHERADQLQPVLRFVTRITQVYSRPAGTTVGYNRRGQLQRASRVAVLSIGYADGLPRLAGEGRFSVLINGQPAPTIGAVCMDMTTVDVTDLPEVTAGEEVVIFGPEHPINLLAKAAQTIPYEIL
ncbi:MAG: alanine racemase, partial [Bacteroidota bacterium]